MILQVKSKTNFLTHFLHPVSRLSNTSIVNVDSDSVSTIIAAADNTAILYAKYSTDLGQSDVKINLPDLGRLIKILQCINCEEFQLELDKNCIKYRDSEIQFKYHLLEEGILNAPPISTDKISNLTFNTKFKVPYTSMINLIRSSTFAVNLNKLYVYTKDGSVYGEINDKQSHNVDSVSVKLCSSYGGEEISDPLPVSFETIRTIAGVKCDDIIVNVNNQLNVMTFDVNNDNCRLTYIISGLVK